MKKTVDMKNKLSFIQRSLDSEEFDVVIKESCSLFEVVFRKIFSQVITILPYHERKVVLDVEYKIGNGRKGVQEFGMGELVGLFRESRLFDKWSKYYSKDLGLIKTVDFNAIVQLRNECTHFGHTCHRREADLIFTYLKALLATIGYSDIEAEEKPLLKTGQKVEMSSAMPNLKKYEEQKGYSSTYGSERDRLISQSNIFKNIDQRNIDYVLKKLGSIQNIVALDIGCAQGYLTFDRFHARENIGKVIGIDYNDDAISEAKKHSENSDKFYYYTIDLESKGFENELKTIMIEHNIEKFDFLFGAYIVQHLNDPPKLLFKLQKFIRRGGFICLRTSEDGSKVCYPDENNIFENLIKMNINVKGMSDRTSGRKLYYYLKKSGFKNIQMHYDVLDTINKSQEEREDLFNVQFIPRYHIMRRLLEMNPNDAALKTQFEWFNEAMEELEIDFVGNEYLYYSETAYSIIGQKQ